VYHTLVLKPTNAWKFAFESRIAPARCGETAVCDLHGSHVKRRCALFHLALRFRKVCIMKLSHFRGSLQDAPAFAAVSEPLGESNCDGFAGCEQRPRQTRTQNCRIRRTSRRPSKQMLGMINSQSWDRISPLNQLSGQFLVT
jgi:hypothetical protein